MVFLCKMYFLIIQNRRKLCIFRTIDALAPESSSRLFFNSRRGLKASYLVRMIKGFYSFISTSIYSSSTYQLSKSISYVITKKKLRSFNTTQIQTIRYDFFTCYLIALNYASIRSIKTKLIQTLVRVQKAITIVQAKIVAQGDVPEITSTSVEKIKYPFTGTISVPVIMTKKQEKIQILKALFANRNGFEMTIKSINVALDSTSTTGAEGNDSYIHIYNLFPNILIKGSVIVSKIHTIDSFGYCLYGEDMKETVLLKMVSELYEVNLKACPKAIM